MMMTEISQWLYTDFPIARDKKISYRKQIARQHSCPQKFGQGRE